MFNNFRDCYLNSATTRMVADQMEILLHSIGRDIANISHLIDADVDVEFTKWLGKMQGVLFTAMVEKNRWVTNEEFNQEQFNEFNVAFVETFIQIAKMTHFPAFDPDVFSSSTTNHFRGKIEQAGIVFKSYVQDYQNFDNRVEYAYENTKSIDRMVNTLIVLVETISSMFMSANNVSVSSELRSMLFQIKEAVDSYMAKFTILLGGAALKEYTQKMTNDTFFMNNDPDNPYSVMRFNTAYMKPPMMYSAVECDKFEQQLWYKIQGIVNA